VWLMNFTIFVDNSEIKDMIRINRQRRLICLGGMSLCTSYKLASVIATINSKAGDKAVSPEFLSAFTWAN
jgi:hypothetical protein